MPSSVTDIAVIDHDGLQAIIDKLAAKGYRVIGPMRRDDAIAYDEISGIEDLPAGWTDSHGPGRYRLEQRADSALFGYNVGPHSWKQFLHPQSEIFLTARNRNGEIEFSGDSGTAPKYAFLGVRACEIIAIDIQDKVFLDGPFIDKTYESRRRDNFIVAVNCGEASETCFCASMQTGPKAEGGYDIALTELLSDTAHEFLVECGSKIGAELLAGVPHRPASRDNIAAAEAAVSRANSQMGRSMDTNGLKEVLQANPNHPR